MELSFAIALTAASDFILWTTSCFWPDNQLDQVAVPTTRPACARLRCEMVWPSWPFSVERLDRITTSWLLERCFDSNEQADVHIRLYLCTNFLVKVEFDRFIAVVVSRLTGELLLSSRICRVCTFHYTPHWTWQDCLVQSNWGDHLESTEFALRWKWSGVWYSRWWPTTRKRVMGWWIFWWQSPSQKPR